MTLAGQPQKAHMQSYYVKWRRVELHGMKPTKLIGSVELMLIDLLFSLKVPRTLKNQVAKTNPCHVDTTKRTLVHTKVTTKLGENYTFTYVATAIYKVKMLCTPLRIVEKQKTSRALQ